MKEQLSKILEPIDSVAFAYLFGSYADGSAAAHSDVDVALFFSCGHEDFETQLDVHHRLQKALGKEVDMVMLNSVVNLALMKSILATGIVVKEAENESRILFELDRHHAILDFEAFKRAIDVA